MGAKVMRKPTESPRHAPATSRHNPVRERGLGVVLPGEPGPLNAITDVVDGRTDGYLNDLTSSPRLKPRDPKNL